MMIGRTFAKMRGSALSEAMIHSLARFGGRASWIAAATAITGRFEDDALFYTEELKQRAELARTGETGGSMDASGKMPSASVAALLLDGPLHDPLDRYLSNCRDELIQSLGDSVDAFRGAPPPDFGPSAVQVSNGPIVGTVRRVELANMEAVAPQLGPTDIACLVEPRVVDDLLTNAGSYFIETQDTDSPLCQRLRNRRSRFAMFDRKVLDRLADGDCVSLPVPRAEGRGAIGVRVPAA
jgi:hypothetical protein